MFNPQLLRTLRGASAGLIVVATLSVVVLGCNSGSRDGFGSNIPGVTFSARPLEVDHALYLTDRLNTPRYSHTATLLDDGRVLIIGGSEENHLEGLTTAEIFDQASFVDTPPLPESESGVWFDNNFLGDPMEMEEARIMHTATVLPDGNVLVAGGVNDLFANTAIESAEIFDVQSREFNPDGLDLEGEMMLPRFRHTATLMPNGKVLIIGGQEARSTAIIDPNNGVTFTILTFPSTEEIEQFDPVQLKFEEIIDLEGDNPELVATNTGRFGQAVVRIAGPDERINSSDDVLVVACGSRTLSGTSAPSTFVWGLTLNDTVDAIEYYDPVSRTVQVAPSVVTTGRNNGVRALNLGEYTGGETYDGQDGVDNVFLVTHGDDDETIQTSVGVDQVYAVTFVGIGPVGGISFSEVIPPVFNSYAHNIEHLLVPLPCLSLFNFGISHGDVLMSPCRRIYGDTIYDSNWAVSMSGVRLFVTPLGTQGQNFVGTGCPGTEIQGVRFFDPFWNVSNATLPLDLDGNPVPPWDLSQTESEQNPTGVVGTWILGHPTLSDAIGIPADPTDIPPNAIPEPYDKYAENFVNSVAPDDGRCFQTLTLLPGFDGVLNTADDRILMTGGGEDYAAQLGGQARSRSALIYLPPNASFNVPD